MVSYHKKHPEKDIKEGLGVVGEEHTEQHRGGGLFIGDLHWSAYGHVPRKTLKVRQEINLSLSLSLSIWLYTHSYIHIFRER